MTKHRYYLARSNYNELNKAIIALGGEPVEIPDAPLTSRIEIFHMSPTNSTIVYNGNKGLAIVAKNNRDASRTRLYLENHLTFKLARIHEQLKHG